MVAAPQRKLLPAPSEVDCDIHAHSFVGVLPQICRVTALPSSTHCFQLELSLRLLCVNLQTWALARTKLGIQLNYMTAGIRHVNLRLLCYTRRCIGVRPGCQMFT